MAGLIVTDPTNSGSSGNKGLNAWSAIRNQAMMSGIYEKDVYEAYNDPEKAQGYLMLLAANGQSLKDRLPSDYSTYLPEAKYSLLAGLSSIMNYEENKAQIDAEAKNSAFNEYYNKNENKNFIDDIVSESFEGDYSKFNTEYQDTKKLYEDGYLVNKNLSEEDVEKGLQEFQASYKKFQEEYIPKEYLTYSQVLESVRNQQAALLQQQIIENASKTKKFFSTLGNMALNVVTVPLEMLESIVDGMEYAIASVSDYFGAEDFANYARSEAQSNFIPTETWAQRLFPASAQFNPYTSNWSPGKLALNVETSMLQMLTMIGLNAASAGAGTAVYYGSIFGSNAVEYDAAHSDASSFNVLSYAAVKTAISYGVEGLSESFVFKQKWTGQLLDAWNKFGEKNVATRLLHDFIGEGLEEAIEECIDGVLDYAWTGKSDFTWENTALSFVAGGLAGAIMSGGQMLVRSAITHHKVIKTIAGDSTVELSNSDAGILLNYYNSLDKKVLSGKKLSTKLQDRYDKIKSMTLKVGDSTISVKQAVIADKIIKTALEELQSTNTTSNVSSEDNTNLNEAALMKAIEKLNIETDEAADLSIEDLTAGLDADANTMFDNLQIGLTVSLNDLIANMAPDEAVKSMQLFTEYSENRVQKILDITTEFNERKNTNASNKSKVVKAYEAKLSEIFGAQVYLKEAVKTTPELQEIKKDLGGLKNIYSYATLDNSLPAAFVYDNNLYIDYAAVNNFAIARLNQLAYSTWYSHRILNSIEQWNINGDSTTMTLLNEAIAGYNLNYTQESNPEKYKIAQQQAIFTMLFIPENTLASKVYMSSKAEYRQIIAELAKHSIDIQNVSAMYVISEAQNVYNRTILNKVPESERSEALKKLNSVITGRATFFENDEALDLYITNNVDPNSFHYMTFKADVNLDAGDLAVALEYFSKRLNFNIPKKAGALSLEGLALSLLKTSNYSDKGAALKKILEGYDGNFVSKINYYLADNFGFQITPDNKIIHLREINRMLDVGSLEDTLINTVNSPVSNWLAPDNGIRLSDYLTDYGKALLCQSIVGNDTLIYLTPKVTNSNTNLLLKPDNGVGSVILLKATPNMTEKALQKLVKTAQHEINHSVSGLSGIKTGQTAYTLSEAVIPRIEEAIKTPEGLKKLRKQFEDFYTAVAIKAPIDKAPKNVDVDAEYDKVIKSFERARDTGKIGDLPYRLSVFAYLYAFPNEEMANGMSLANQNIDSIKFDRFNTSFTNRVYISTRSELEFLKLFDGLQANIFVPTSVNQILGRYTNKEITQNTMMTGIAASAFGPSEGEASIEDIREVLNVRPDNDQDLISRDWWVSQATGDLRNVLRSMRQEDFIKLIANITKQEYNVIKGKFEAAGTADSTTNFMNIPISRNSNYSAAIVNKIKPRNLVDASSVYSKYGDDINGLIKYNSKRGTCVIELSTKNLGKSTIETIRKAEAFTTPGNRMYIVGERSFINVNNAANYLDTSEKHAGNVKYINDSSVFANFEAVFSELTSRSITGLQQEYNYDTIYVTNDGQIFNFNSDADLISKIQSIAKTLKADNIFGKYTIDTETGDINVNDEGLTQQLTDLLNSKKVMRFRKSGNNWIGYGIANSIQDRFSKTINARFATPQGYVEIKSTKALVQDPETLKVSIVDRNADGSVNGTEVEWRKNKWYDSICRIMTKYDITSFKEFEQLGFSQKFIDMLSTYTGARTISSGIRLSEILSYINDDSNSKHSRNILIANCPDSDTNSLDWKRNGYLRTVEDALQYRSIFEVYYATMVYAMNFTDDPKIKDALLKVYNNQEEMHQAFDGFIKVHENDAKFISTIEAVRKTLDKRLTSMTTDLLNLDAQKNLKFSNGLNYSFNAFSYVYSLIKQDFGLNAKETSIEQQASYKGDEDVVNLLDTLDKTKNNVQRSDSTKELTDTLDEKIIEASQILDPEAKLNAYDNLLNELDNIAKQDIYGDINIDAYASMILDQMDKIENINKDTSTSANEYIEKLKPRLAEVKNLSGIERDQRLADIESEFHSFVNNRVKNTMQYGYQGYKAIRKVYADYGASRQFNNSSKISKRVNSFTKQVNQWRKDNKINEKTADKMIKQADTFKTVYQGILQVPVAFEANGLTRNSVTDLLINAFDNFTSGIPIASTMKQISDFVDTAAIESKLTFNDETQLAETDFRFSKEQKKYLYALNKVLEKANSTAKLNLLLKLLNDPGIIDEVGSPVVAILTKWVDDLKVDTSTQPHGEEAIDFDKLFSAANEVGIDTSKVKEEIKPKKKQLTQEQIDSLSQSRATLRAFGTQKRHADLLTDSTPATDFQMKQAILDVYTELYNHKFVIRHNPLLSAAKAYYKDNKNFAHENEVLKEPEKYSSNEVESARRHREQTIRNWMETHAEEFGFVKSKDRVSQAYKNLYVKKETAKNTEKQYATPEQLEAVRKRQENKFGTIEGEGKNNIPLKFGDWSDVKGFAEMLDLTKSAEEQKPQVKKILEGLNIAYIRFIYGPKTWANIEQFKNEVQYVLNGKAINQIIPGTKELIKLSGDGSTLRILDTLKNGKYEDRSKVFATELGNMTQEMKEAQATIDEVTNARRVENAKARTRETSEKARKRMALKNNQAALDRLLAAADDGNTNISNEDLNDIVDASNINMDTLMGLFDDDTDANTDVAPTTGEESIDFDNLFGDDAAALNQELFNKKPKKEPRTEDQMYNERNPERGRVSPTINSPLLTRDNVNVNKMLNYVPSKTKDIVIDGVTEKQTVFSTAEFLADNAADLNAFTANINAVQDFMTWYSKNPTLTGQERTVVAVLLNQISHSLVLPKDIRIEATKAFNQIKRSAGQQLSVARNMGLTPIDELAALAEESIDLSEEEKKLISDAAAAQKLAIQQNRYDIADKMMQSVIDILQQHSGQLDNKINPWQKGLNPEEKALRWHNLTQRITSWRYFAMLSAPATFFSRNVAGNAMIGVIDKAARGLGSVFNKLVGRNSKDGIDRYRLTNNQASSTAKTVVKEQLVDNGLLDAILENTVSKYDTGFKTSNNKLNKLLLNKNTDIETLETRDKMILSDMLNSNSPFGNSTVGNAFNFLYNKIFGVMDAQDKRVMRKYIQQYTEKLVSDNFTEVDYAKLKDGDKNTITKFQDMVNYAQNEALKTYFRYTPKAYTTMMNLLAKHPVAQTIIATILPFPRMMLNTMSTALSYSPLGFINALRTYKTDESMFRNIKVSKQLGQATVGTLAMFAGALLASLGVIAFDDDDKYGGPKLNLFGTIQISLEDLEPAMIPFSVGATFVDSMTEGIWKAFTDSGAALLDTTIIGDLINIFGGNKTSVDILSNAFTTYVNQFIPAVLRHITRTIDSSQKKYSSNSGLKVLQKLAAQFPGLSFAVPNKIDPYTGKDVKYYDDSNSDIISRLLVLFNAFSPAKVSYTRDSLIENESKKYNANTTGPSKQFTIDGKTYSMSDKEYRKYQQLRAKLYSESANKLIATERYKKMTDEQKKKALKKLQQEATNKARKQLNIG